ncbi:MAG: DUF1178 family protein [Erythrobacter sp.]
MIVYDLQCEAGHRFEGWFGSSSDFEDQNARALVSCPTCGSSRVEKAPMAPAVPAKSNSSKAESRPSNAMATQPVSNAPMPPEMEEAVKALAKAQEKVLQSSTYVGDKFTEQSREMHYGERDEAPIYGQASVKEAKALVDEGVPIAPLPFPIAPPDKLN